MQAQGSSALFSAGVSRLESLLRSARLLEGLAAGKQAGGAPQAALSLRLLAVQVLPPSCQAVPLYASACSAASCQ